MSEDEPRSPILHTKINFRRATWQEALKHGFVITVGIILFRLISAWTQGDFSDFAQHLIVSVFAGAVGAILTMLFPVIYEELK